MFETREQLKTHAPPVSDKRDNIEYMAYTGQYEFVYSFIRKLGKELRENYCDKNIMSQAIWGSIIDFSELGDFINEPVKNYSSGMYARLAFAIATDIELEVLLVDEVFGCGR